MNRLGADPRSWPLAVHIYLLAVAVVANCGLLAFVAWLATGHRP